MEPQLRTLVRERAQSCCEYCQLPDSCSTLPFQVDHIISVKHGGATHEANLAWSCGHCNSHKGPNISGYIGGKHVPLFNPRTDAWTDHLDWNGPFLGAKSEIGEATIHVLAMNTPELIQRRFNFIEEGIFPPNL